MALWDTEIRTIMQTHYCFNLVCTNLTEYRWNSLNPDKLLCLGIVNFTWWIQHQDSFKGTFHTMVPLYTSDTTEVFRFKVFFLLLHIKTMQLFSARSYMSLLDSVTNLSLISWLVPQLQWLQGSSVNLLVHFSTAFHSPTNLPSWKPVLGRHIKITECGTLSTT